MRQVGGTDDPSRAPPGATRAANRRSEGSRTGACAPERFSDIAGQREDDAGTLRGLRPGGRLSLGLAPTLSEKRQRACCWSGAKHTLASSLYPAGQAYGPTPEGAPCANAKPEAAPNLITKHDTISSHLPIAPSPSLAAASRLAPATVVAGWMMAQVRNRCSEQRPQRAATADAVAPRPVRNSRRGAAERYGFSATGGPLTRFTFKSMATSTWSAIVTKGMPLVMP